MAFVFVYFLGVFEGRKMMRSPGAVVVQTELFKAQADPLISLLIFTGMAGVGFSQGQSFCRNLGALGLSLSHPSG